MTLDAFDALAHGFLTLRPAELDPRPPVPEGYRGGKRARHYAESMRALFRELHPDGGERLPAPAGDAADRFDELAYRFWSLHPNEIAHVPAPEAHPGGRRAWFYASEMRALFAREAARLAEEGPLAAHPGVGGDSGEPPP